MLLFILIYFRSVIFSGLAYGSHFVFRPILVLENNLEEQWIIISSFFKSKKSIFMENENLKSELNEISARISNYNSVLEENTQIKEILGRKNEKTVMILAAILGKSNQNLYDTVIIDVGVKQKIKVGDTVFALGNVPIGRIAEAYADSSKVILFSSGGEKTEAMIASKNVFMPIVGRGGGNFEMILPRDFSVEKGNQVVLPGLTPYVLAIVQTIISDPRDALQKALLVSPVNIQELKFVEIKTN